MTTPAATVNAHLVTTTHDTRGHPDSGNRRYAWHLTVNTNLKPRPQRSQQDIIDASFPALTELLRSFPQHLSNGNVTNPHVQLVAELAPQTQQLHYHCILQCNTANGQPTHLDYLGFLAFVRDGLNTALANFRNAPGGCWVNIKSWGNQQSANSLDFAFNIGRLKQYLRKDNPAVTIIDMPHAPHQPDDDDGDAGAAFGGDTTHTPTPGRAATVRAVAPAAPAATAAAPAPYSGPFVGTIATRTRSATRRAAAAAARPSFTSRRRH